MATDSIISDPGKTYMAIRDEMGRTHFIELTLLRRTAAALEREGVDITRIPAASAARLVLTRILHERGELLN